jgi:aspartyl-tRNA(Asn)/glutamyl-tRNA(Gln) amidotransferase subunit A
MDWGSISELVKNAKSGKVTAADNVKKALSLIDKATEFNAVLEKIENRSIERAEQIDKDIANGQNPGKLAGVPFIVKDNYLTFDSETTAASNILKGFKAPYQATVVEKLEAEGAICVGKANLDSFAHGGSTENSDFGPTKNPHDKTRVPGGSSGGSATVVALGIVPFALGSDTGGSIRLPASFTGTVGLKPTYGIASRFGVVAMASSTDVMGPITRSSEDAALVMEVIAGVDEKDSTTIDSEIEDFTNLDIDIKNLKIGVIKQHMSEGVDETVVTKINQTIDKIKSLGASIEEVDMPNIDLSLAVYYIVMPAEVSSNLGRYDGIRFGYSDESAANLDDVYESSRSQGFNREVQRRIMIGTYVLSSGYYDAYYKKAQLVRTKIINDFEQAFKNYDLLVGPVSPTTAFKLGENTQDPLKMYLVDVMTTGASIAGLPAISSPVGDVEGLPVGLQITGPQKSDRLVIALSNAVEEITEIPQWN